jgi:hypothetical protein
MADDKTAAEGAAIVAQLRAFLEDHPEVAAELGMPEPAGPPVPLTLYHVLHDLIDAAHLHGTDDERRAQYHAVVDEHEKASKPEAEVQGDDGTESTPADPYGPVTD